MFRLIQTIIVILLAFSAGILFEYIQMSSKCSQAGGEFSAGLCRGAAK